VANLITSLGFIFILLLSLYGWGRLCLHQLVPNSSFSWAYKASFGMAVWIFLGGVFNLLSIAKPQPLWCIFFLGLLFSGYLLKKEIITFFRKIIFSNKYVDRKQEKPGHQSNLVGYSILYISLFVLIVFYIQTLMPTHLYNPYDDFWTYMVRPLRMLGIGSLENHSPFSIVPMDSLGGQAFMQAFFVMMFDIEYINGFDQIFCLILTAFLIIEIGKQIKVPFKVQLLAVAIFIVWYPINVNVSSVYSASLLILGAVASLMMWYKKAEKSCSVIEKIKLQIPFAFFISAIVTLKTTIAFYVVVFFFFDFFLGLTFTKNKKQFSISYVTIGFIVLLLTSPWLILYQEKILILINSIGASAYDSNMAVHGGSIWTILKFDNMHLYWGGRLYWFLVIFVTMIVAAFAALFLLWKKRELPHSNLWIIPLTSICLSISSVYFITYTSLPWGYMIEHAIRYNVPILLAALPILSFLFYFVSENATPKLLTGSFVSSSLIKKSLIPGAQIILVLYVGIFLSVFVDNIQKLNAYNTNLSIFSKSAIRHWARDTLANNSVKRKNELAIIQAKVPKGEKILVLISTPFHLDFARNQIENIHPNDLTWNRILGNSIEKVLETFKKREIGYIILQYKGYTIYDRKAYMNIVNKNNERTNYFGKLGVYYWDTFSTLKERGDVLYWNEESQTVLFKIKYPY
jgi:hypothetical protein